PDRPDSRPSAMVSKEQPRGVAAPTPVIQIGIGELTVSSPLRPRRLSTLRTHRLTATNFFLLVPKIPLGKHFPTLPEMIPDQTKAAPDWACDHCFPERRDGNPIVAHPKPEGRGSKPGRGPGNGKRDGGRWSRVQHPLERLLA